MAYPILNTPRISVDMTDVFKGYNHNVRIGAGEFFDMKNLTSDEYPVLSPRKPRTVAETSDLLRFLGLVAKDTLGFVSGSQLYVDGHWFDLGLDTSTQKTLVSMGNYVLVFPDKKYVNTQDYDDFGDIEADAEYTGDVTVFPCDINGNTLTILEAFPETPAHGDIWHNSIDGKLYQYDSEDEKWVIIETTYVRLGALNSGLGAPFAEMDGVEIYDADCPEIPGLNGSHVIWHKDADFIVIEGSITGGVTIENGLKIARALPEMDYVIEAGNRLWGCRYGPKRDGSFGNEIYASKPGDFKNWQFFAGISTDSYAASVGSDGAFTGAVNYGGSPLFFKENMIHKVYGQYPANFQITDTACRGVQKGCSRSLAIVNEVLYYKSRSGVCAYDGSAPVEVSDALGHEVYHDAVAGGLGHKYYVSMLDPDDIPHMFAYDTRFGTWHKEDNTRAYEFCNFENRLYFTEVYNKPYNQGAEYRITCISGEAGNEGAVKWMAETGIIGTDTPYRTYIQRLDVRMSLELGSHVSFFIQYDSTGAWEHVYTADYRELSSFSVPIRPRRCDHLRIRMVGTGPAKIFSICKHTGKGSERS
jgi:hypothetical protein